MKFREYSFSAEEFVVEEITNDGVVLEVGKPANFGAPEDASMERDYFARFVLQKRNWNSMQAIGEIARRLHVNPKRFDFAGTKDRNALTTQQCSAFAIAPERLLALEIRDLNILGAWKSKSKVRLGDLAGNRFTITLTPENCGSPAIRPNPKKISAKAKRLGFRFPNYFGSQRFGSMRGNAADVGFALLKKDFEGAVNNYLSFVAEGEREGAAREAREKLAKDGSEDKYAKALDYFPRFLKYERMLLEHLARAPKDFAGAFSRFPRHLQLLFVHALQSELFNAELEARVKKKKLFAPQEGDWWCGRDSLGFPLPDEAKPVGGEGESADEVKALVEKGDAFLVGTLVGLDSVPTPGQEKLLKKKKIAVEDFKFTTLPWLTTRGGRRALYAPLLHFAVVEGEKEEEKKNSVRVRFALPSGCYATIAVQELLKP